MLKENLFIKKIPYNHVLLLSKNPVTVEWFSSPIPYFRDKNKGNLAFNQKEQDKSSDIEQQPSFGDRKISNIQSSNQETCMYLLLFDFYEEWKSVLLELLTSICNPSYTFILVSTV